MYLKDKKNKLSIFMKNLKKIQAKRIINLYLGQLNLR